MIYILVYDVSDDDIRDKVRELIKNWGGIRFQYSAFMIDLSEIELNELLKISARLISDCRGNVVAIPICKRDLDKLIILGNSNIECEVESDLIV
ncbi:MAG: CRISPR-associated endonuclease Cas2 [archaeon GB-1867-035]|nr:CRISPR-associated endonuclease Cas2 [Candidatus Culexmicrobium profundum]